MTRILSGQIFLEGFHKIWFLNHFLLLVCVNNLSENLSCNSKLFANDTSPFSAVYDIRTGFFLSGQHFFFKKNELHHKFLDKSPRSNGEVAKFSEKDLLYDIN